MSEVKTTMSEEDKYLAGLRRSHTKASDFILLSNNQAVLDAYNRMANPRKYRNGTAEPRTTT